MSNITILIPQLGNKYVDDRARVWGDSFNWDFDRTTNDVKYIACHHSVTAQTGNWKDEVDKIASIHQARGWGGVGYHFIICSDGTVAYVGDVGQARANVLGKNEQVIGICFVGDFTQILPTDAQISSGHILIKLLLSLNLWSNLKGWENVVGHKELQATACPSIIWKGSVDNFYERLKNNIPYTPPVTTVTVSSSSSSTTTVSTSSITTQAPQLPDCCTKVEEAKTILYGKGFIWSKQARLKELLPK